VWREDLEDGQKALGLVHSAAVIDGIFDRLTQQARAVQVANTKAAKDAATAGCGTDDDTLGDARDDRSLDQVRADLCADVLLTGSPSGHDTTDGLLGAIHARVEVTVPVFTLMTAEITRAAGATGAAGRGTLTGAPGCGTLTGTGSAFGVRVEQAGELAGGQPIDTDTARILAVDRYRPNADLRRLLHARDSRCRFFACGLPPVTQDLDHTIDAAFGGATEEGNLGGLCRRHHVLKHQTAWKVKQLGAGILEWTSPAGNSYIDKPPSPVTFTVEDPDPPPEPSPF